MPLHELICTEIWGGNGNIFADLHIPGLRGVIYSNACGGDKGGDVYYATACSSGLIGRCALPTLPDTASKSPRSAVGCTT